MQHQAVAVVVECCTSDSETWLARLQARASSEAGSCTGHKPASWEKLTALVDSYVGAVKPGCSPDALVLCILAGNHQKLNASCAC